jgi:hypothetical protein
MRRLLGVAAVVLGVVGVLVCAAAIGLGWWAAVTTADRVTRAAARADQGLAGADASLARTEERLAAIRADLDEVRGEAEKLTTENPELPRVRAAIERLLDRLIPTIERAAALADSLRTVAAGFRAAADIRDLVGGETRPAGRARTAADAIDGAAETLNIPRARIDAVKSAAAVRLVRELVALAREAAAGSEQLAEGLADARREIAGARVRAAEWRGRVVFWVYAAAAAHTLVWLWVGLGQLCLVGWGRRRFARRVLKAPGPGHVGSV